jgi:uncharacterized membrane protein
MDIVETLRPLFDSIRLAVAALGALIVLWGVAEAIWHFIRLRTVEHSTDLFVRASSIRERLSVHLLLALDIFIGADLIATVLHPDWTSVGVLAAIVAIRVVLTVLLTREMSEIHAIIERHGHPNRRGDKG